MSLGDHDSATAFPKAATGINKRACPFDVACGFWSGLVALSCGWTEL